MSVTGTCASCHNGQSLGVVSMQSVSHIPTQQPCELCHTNTSTFLSYQMGAAGHAGITSGCYICHGGPQAGAATYPNVVSYQASAHIPIPLTGDCNNCHTNFVTFLGASYTHTAGSTCASCHQGQYLNVVSINPSIHIPLPAGSTCASCHPDPVTQPIPTFLGVAFHTTTIGNPPSGTCLSCHNGSYTSQNAQAKGTNHIPTSSGCGSCHTGPGGIPANNTINYTSFLDAKFHQTSLGNPPTGLCSTCHSGSYLSEGAQGQSAGHVSTTADCVTCHTGPNGTNNTANYTSFLGATFSHQPGVYSAFPADGAVASPSCMSCHNGTTATGKVAGHITTSADCNSGGCHTTATDKCPNCVNFTGIAFNHINSTTGYTSFTSAGPSPYTKRCDSCHNGSTLLAQPVNAGHVPTAGADCIACHTATSTNCAASGACSTFLNAVFSHSGTTAPSGSCGTCHQSQYSGVVSINPAVHIPQTSGNACDTCHTGTLSNLTTTPTFNNVYFHQNALGNPPTGLCSACHNGSYVTPPSGTLPATGAQSTTSVISNHVATTADCVTCHTATNTASYTSFLGAGYTHSPGTYSTWPPASPVTPACSSCHNGVTATGTNAGHPVITTDCMGCHTAVAVGSAPAVLQGCPNCTLFGIPAGVVHNVAPYNTPGTCSTCHNGTTAIGLSSDTGHIPTGSIGCDQCHSVYDGVGSINFSTTASSTITVSGTSKYRMNHSALTAGTLCGTSCHNGSYTSQGVYGAVTKVSNHIPTAMAGATADCTFCHTTLTLATVSVVSGTADWLPETVGVTQHNGDQGGAPNYCVTCHLSSATYLSSKIQKVSHNGASTSKDCSSSSCHKPLGGKGSSYTSWN